MSLRARKVKRGSEDARFHVHTVGEKGGKDGKLPAVDVWEKGASTRDDITVG